MGNSLQQLEFGQKNDLHVHADSVVPDSVSPMDWSSPQAPQSVEFSSQEYWNGLPFPILGDFPDPGFSHESPVSPALAGGFFATEPPVQFSSVQSLSREDSWRPHESQHARPPCPSPTPGVHPNSCPSSQ